MKRNTNETSSDVEEGEVRMSNIKERFKKIWSSNIIQRLLCFLSSIWIYVPIIFGLFAHMIYMIPLAYTSWVLFFSLGGSWAEVHFGFNLTGEYLPLGILVTIFEIEVFIGGLALFIWGVIQIARARKKDIHIAQTGPHKYIRHPQHLGIILISLPLVFLLNTILDSYIRVGFRIGDMLSWILFCFILIIWSDIEERKMQKKYPEEFSIYKSKTGFFFPKIGDKQTLKVQKKKRYYYLIRYLSFFTIYCIAVLIMFLVWKYGFGEVTPK